METQSLLNQNLQAVFILNTNKWIYHYLQQAKYEEKKNCVPDTIGLVLITIHETRNEKISGNTNWDNNYWNNKLFSHETN